MNTSRTFPHLLGPLCLVPLVAASAASGDPVFDKNVDAYFRSYCYECHDAASSKGGMNLEVIQKPADFREHPTALTHVIEQLDLGEMPPKKAKQPSPAETAAAMEWLQGELARQRQSVPDDPGIVVSPRLNSSEYGNAIRDVTGTTAFDASSFVTAEGGAGEGFSNVGAAHSMGTTQFESYLSAAQRVLSHARITPQSGLSWASAPQGEVTDQQGLVKKLRQNWTDWLDVAISEAAKAHVKDLSAKTGGLTWMAYMERAWMFKHRAAFGLKWATLEDAARDGDVELYPESLAAFYTLLTGEGTLEDAHAARKSPITMGLVARIDALPTTPRPPAAIRQQFKEIDEWARRWINSGRFSKDGNLIDLTVKNDSSQTRLGGSATHALDLTKSKTGEMIITVADCGDGHDDDILVFDGATITFADGSKKPWQQVFPAGLPVQGRTLAWGADPSPNPIKLEPGAIAVAAPAQIRLKLPAGARSMEVSIKTHPSHPNSSMQCSFDDAPPEMAGGRILNRVALAISRSKRAREFDDTFKQIGLVTRFGSFTKAREAEAYHGLPWFDAKTAAALGIKFPQKTPPGGYAFRVSPATLIAKATPAERIRVEQIANQLRELAATGGTSDPAAERTAAGQLITEYATRAWRRPPTAQEISGLAGLYDSDRAAGLPYEFAVKTALKAVLVSPEFLYRFQESQNTPQPYALSDRDLAIRLAFFLWSGPPDEELLRLAAQRKLSEPNTLLAQAQRMLADPRARALATEFAGQWLLFSGFDTFSGPDPEKFKSFTPSLRQAMYDETVTFLLDLFQSNRPITELVAADSTYLNEELAKHYGIDGVKGTEMRRVSLPPNSPRGGLLGMGSILTKLSAPLRTSPVKRGVWVYEEILGVKLPAPPPNVPQLSDTETNDQGLTIARQLEQHRANPACATCHAKFDALGFALENFDPVGRWREKDGAGNPVETNEKLNTGATVDGVPGLRKYLASRMDEVVMTFCRKLAGFALGRGIIPSDEPLLKQMAAAAKAQGNRPQPAMAVLLASKQFRFRRDDAPAAASTSTNPPAQAPVAAR